jgi:O-antigen/teichoic acid export membrane protein
MSLRRNAVANYLGQGWATVMGFIFVPQYLRLVGPNAYGLVGVFAILQASMALLDLGITPTVNREMARLSAGAHTAKSIRGLLRTLEWIYGAIASIGVIVVWFGVDLLVVRWIHPGGLSQHTIIQAVRVMGFVLATRAIEQMYRGALLGVQDVIWMNVVQAIVATVRWGGAFIVLIIRPEISIFFLWQGIVSAITVGLYCSRIYSLLPKCNEHVGFELAALKKIRGYAGGMLLGVSLSVLLTQTDKIVVGRLLPLAILGYYTVASTLAGGLLQLIVPMNNSIFPILAEQVARNDDKEIYRTYITSCEWMAALIVPPALVMTFFAKSALLVWTGSLAVSDVVAPLVSVLAAGTLLHGLLNIPYMIQLAYGWVSLSVWMNLAAALVAIPCFFWAVSNYGAMGAAGTWLALNVAYLFVNANLMHRRILIGRKRAWYMRGVIVPLAAGGLVALLMKPFVQVESRMGAAFFVAAAAAAITASVGVALPEVRSAVLGRFGWARAA